MIMERVYLVLYRPGERENVRICKLVAYQSRLMVLETVDVAPQNIFRIEFIDPMGHDLPRVNVFQDGTFVAKGYFRKFGDSNHIIIEVENHDG